MRTTRSDGLRRLPLGLALGVVAGNFFLHLPISDVCDWARERWGFPLYDRAALIAIPLLTVGVLVPLLRRHAARWRQGATWCAAVSLAVMTLAAQRWMLVANIELIHFPQFGLIAALLLAAGMAAEPAWLLATGAGMLDEAYQQLVIYAARPDTYLDFNDMVLNAIGAAWIVVAFAPHAAARASWVRWPRATVWLIPLIVLALVVVPPQLTPFLRASIGGTPYRVIGLTEALVWGAMLWGFGAISTTTRTGAAPKLPSSARGFPMLVLCLALLSGCALRRPAPVVPTSVSSFITTFWCGPPLAELDDARATEIADAGFTVIGAPCEGPITPDLNQRALDVAARHGLRVWVMDHRYNPLAAEHADAAQIAAAVDEYQHHPAFDGYFVQDEPPVELFETVKPVVEQLHARDPSHVAYVNLLPEYVKPGGFGAEDYGAYVDQFIEAVHPRLLSYDYYPFGKEKDRSTFFSNLAIIRERALRNRIPFLLIVLAMPHGAYREPSEAELAWQVFHALAFGARGISYFAYWTPVHVEHADEMQFRSGLIEGGRPTAMYFRAQRLNREVNAIAAQLDGYRSVAVADAVGDVAAPLPIGPLAGIDGGAITVGFFARDHGHLAALLVNRDYKYGAAIALRLRAGAALPESFDAERGRWAALTGPALVLSPGHGRLLRWRR